MYTVETYQSESGWGWSVNRNGILDEGCEADIYPTEGIARMAAFDWLCDRHVYESPCISVLWKDVVQPMGLHKTMREALYAIAEIGHPSPLWALRTPEGDIKL